MKIVGKGLWTSHEAKEICIHDIVIHRVLLCCSNNTLDLRMNPAFKPMFSKVSYIPPGHKEHIISI